MRKLILAAVALVLLIVVLVVVGIIPACIRAYAMPSGIVSFGNITSLITVPTKTEEFGIKELPIMIEDNNGRNIKMLFCYLAPGRSLAFTYEPVTYSSLGTPIGFYSGVRLVDVEGCFTGPNGVSAARNTRISAVPIAINGGITANAGHAQTLTICFDLQKSGQITIYALQRGLVAQGAAVAACP